MPEPVLVLGVGNILLGDDGVGIHVVGRLRKLDVPRGVEVVDGGTGGLALAGLIDGRRKVILVDAVAEDAPQGSVFRFTGGDALPLDRRAGSAHDEGIGVLIRHAADLIPPPEIVIIGVVPGPVDEHRIGLSPEVEAGVETALRILLAEVGADR